jgi:uncharacterized membrane protein YphA (DoxX/SURF4 family)
VSVDRLRDRVLATDAPGWVILIRLMVGAVFLSEGVQKILYPAELGAGRFARIGLPAPEALGPVVATFEIACGLLVLAGFLTRVAAVPLITIMVVAIATTKVPILLAGGVWKVAHEARTDWSMLLGALYLLVVGGGAWSMDARIRRASRERP